MIAPTDPNYENLARVLAILLDKDPGEVTSWLGRILDYSDRGVRVGDEKPFFHREGTVYRGSTASVAEACERLESRGYFPTGFFARPDASFEGIASCDQCGGDGRDPAGDGYTSICDGCAGDSTWTYPASTPDYYTARIGWAPLGPKRILEFEEQMRECRRRLAAITPETHPYAAHVTWRWGDREGFSFPVGGPSTLDRILVGKADFTQRLRAYEYRFEGPNVASLRARIDLWNETMARVGPNPYEPLLPMAYAERNIAGVYPQHSVLLTGGVPPQGGMVGRSMVQPAPWRHEWRK